MELDLKSGQIYKAMYNATFFFVLLPKTTYILTVSNQY